MDWLLQAHCRYFSTTLRGRLPYCLCRPMFSFRRRRVLPQELRCMQPPDLKTSLIDGVHNDLSPSLMSSGSLLVTTYLRGRLPYAASCLFFASRPGQCQVLPQELRRTISLLVQCHSLQAAGRYYRLILYLQSPACCLHPSRLFVCRASSPQHASLHHPLFHSADAIAIHDIPIIISYCF